MVYGIIGIVNFTLMAGVYDVGSYVSFMIIAALMMMGNELPVGSGGRRIYQRLLCQAPRLEVLSGDINTGRAQL